MVLAAAVGSHLRQYSARTPRPPVGKYGLAGVGPCAGRIGTIARTLVVLNSAALLALVRFVRGSQKVTW